MNKTEFLEKIRSGLGGIPQKDIDERLAFYSEMIDDRIEDGITEEEAVAQTGSADEIIAQIVSDYPLNKLVKEKIRPERRLRAWEIVLIVLGFPLCHDFPQPSQSCALVEQSPSTLFRLIL